ncbi:MAG TPA: BTAD domain-containing putative transcriptional regulator, partial [Candidatus Limnocylindrales bacterium]|nr:BTAD domain-containing putative transcriptional regulator [Candidatus Limnocylindrales bacterium]
MATSRGDLHVRLLGPVDVVVGGRVIDVAGRRQRTLLALLALEPARVIATDRLIEELWAGEPTDGASTTLKVHATRLRATLGDRFPIRGSSAGYALEVDPDVVDATQFEQLLEAARRDAVAHPRRAARAAQAALDLWRGSAFGDLADEGALRAAADRLEELRLEAVELRVDAALALGRSNELVAELEALVAAHPYRERFWRQLMLALYRSDRQADALAAYHRARTALDEQLGIEPGAALQDLEAAILRQEVEPAHGSDTRGVRRSFPHHVSRFLGRRRELAELRGLVGRHRLITLVGPGGVGKTRLAIEAAGAVNPDDVGEPAFVDLSLVGDAADVPGHVARALGVAEAPGRTPEAAIAEQLRDASVLIVLDNCEHVREAAAALVEHLLSSCPEARVLATSRELLGIVGEQTFVVGPLR